MNYLLFSSLQEDNCNQLNSRAGVGVGLFIIFIILLSYIPQYYKIFNKKSNIGISNYYIFLYNIANFTNFYGTLLINFKLVNCCLHLSSSDCMNLLIPIFQMFIPWIGVFILYIFFLIYDDSHNLVNKNILLFIIFNTFFIFILGIIGMCFLLKYHHYQENVKQFGDTLNIISSITCILCIFPQILTTYKNKNIGNLSLITLGIQTPGSFIVFIYQVFIINAPISIGIPYLFSFILQLILLLECIYFLKFYKHDPLIYE